MEKILVVDDNELNCDMVCDVLEEWGFCVKRAYQGIEVLPIVETFKPDLILLDVMLPGMNGFEICKRIKSDPNKNDIAIILLTVLNDVDDRTQGVNVGADLFLSKPVNYKELRKQIEFVLNKKKKLADMESIDNICEFLLNLIKVIDIDLYKIIYEIKDYSLKLADILSLKEDDISKIKTGVVFYGLGYIIKEKGFTEEEIIQVVSPLKIAPNIYPYIGYSKELKIDLSNEEIEIGIRILYFLNKFCKLKAEGKTSKEAYNLLTENEKDKNNKVVKGFEQIIEDETFMNDLFFGDILLKK